MNPALGAGEQRTLRCRTVSTSGFQHLNYVRDLPPLVVDEPLTVPPAGTAVTPSETLLMALGSCLAARIRADAITGTLAVRSLVVEAEVDVDRSPLWGMAGRDARHTGFEAIRVTVHLDADASADALRALVSHAVLWSPVASTLHDPVQIDVQLRDAQSGTVEPGPRAPIPT